MSFKRIVVLMVVAVAVAGCTKPPSYAKKKTTGESGGDKTTAATTTPAGVANVPPAPPQEDPSITFTKAFLADVQAGKATASQLTPAFKTIIAEPVFKDDEAGGFSDSAATDWLKKFAGTLSAPVMTPAVGTADVQVSTGLVAAAKPGHVMLRIVKAEGGWKVDWFNMATVGPVSATLPAGESAFVPFAAMTFLDAVLGKTDRAAEGLMTLPAKQRLASGFASDKRGYNRGILEHQFTELRGTFTGYSLGAVTGETVVGKLVKPDGERAFTLKLVKGTTPGAYMVESVTLE